MSTKVKPTKGTGGKGQEYEWLVPAAFFLILYKDENIKNIVMYSNIKNFGKFDDLLVMLTKHNQAETENYAFQLKHKEENNVKMKPECLMNSKDFGLLKYSKSFIDDIAKKDEYHLIMYTNAHFNGADIENGTNFKVVPHVICRGRKYFFQPEKIDDKNAVIYNFQVKDEMADEVKKLYEDFFEKFSFYTCQRNWKQLETFVINEFKSLFGHQKDRRVAMEYISFFKQWKFYEFSNLKVTTEEILIQIMDNTLSPHIITPVSEDDNERFQLLEEAIKCFDFAIVKDIEEKILKKLISYNYVTENEDILHLAKDDKHLTKDKTEDNLGEKIKIKIKNKIGYYRRGQPIIVNVNETNKTAIIQTILKLKEKLSDLHFIFKSNNITEENFPNYTVFKNMNDLLKNQKALFDQMIKKLKILLLDREYSYEELFGFDENIAKQITIKEIFQMLNGTFRIDIGKEVLTEPHIPRKVSKSLIKTELLAQICNETDDILVIDSCTDNLKTTLKNALDIERFVDVDEYLRRESDINLKKTVLFKDKQIFEEHLAQIYRENPEKHVHHVKEYNDEFLQWMSSTKSRKELKKFEIVKLFCVKERDIHEKFQNRINVIISRPGMGKSEMLKELYNSCPQDYFPVKINLKEHNHFFSEKRSIEDVLDYCLKQLNDPVLVGAAKSLSNKKKVIFFFDGIDELFSDRIDYVLDNIKELSLRGFRIWLSSRPNLLVVIEDKFKVFSTEIMGFGDRQQKQYIRSRLEGKHKNIDQVIGNIFTNIETIAENCDILEVPLQLFMITEILTQYQDEIIPNIFVLTRMFQYFIAGKYLHFFKKRKCNHMESLEEILNDSKTYRMEQYEIAALKSCFSKEEFQFLNLKQDKKFIEQVRKEGDFLGIISMVSDNAVVFNHNIIAEYFGALWLAENSRDIGSFLKTVLFKEKYSHVKLMFDMILGENCPGHIAILYRNIDELCKCDKIDHNDKGRRSALHLLCSHVYKYPNVDFENEIVDKKTISNNRKIDDEYREILHRLLEAGQEPFSTDSLFEWNSLDYIDNSFFLLPLEIILEKFDNSCDLFKLNIFKSSKKKALYCSALLSYQNLFKKLYSSSNLEKAEAQHLLHLVASTSDNYKIIDFLLDEKVDILSKTSKQKRTALHLAALNGHLQIATLLIFKDKNLVKSTDYIKRTPLHLAAANGHFQIVKELLKNEAEVDPPDSYGRTPLHLAVENGHSEIIKFLLDEKNADIDKAASNGWTPLHLAVVEGRPDIVQLLLEKNASFDKMDSYGTKPLHIAAKRRNIDIIDMLLTQSKNVDEMTRDRRTCLHLAAEFGGFESVKFLLKKKADIKAVDDNGRNVLHWAVIGGVETIVSFLVDKKDIDIDLRDDDGKTPLQWAAEKGLSNIVKILLEKKAKVNDAATNGSTALHWAARGGHDEIVSLLLQNGANIDATDVQGKTPLDWAVLENRQATEQLLRNWKIDRQ